MDRKSKAHIQIARLAALATTSLIAAALLLAGADATFGIDVPTSGATSQVTQTVQSVTTTTQQAVTNVQTTVQPTVQAVAQPVEQAAQPVAAPVQQTAAPVTSVPKASAPRAAAPAETTTAPAKTAARVRRAAGAVRQSAGTVAKTPAAVRQAANAPAAHKLQLHAVAGHANRTRTTRTHQAATTTDGSCDPTGGVLGLLSPVLGALGQDALLSVACDAGALLNTPRIGISLPTGATDRTAAGGVFGVIAASQRLLHQLLSPRVYPVSVHRGSGPQALGAGSARKRAPHIGPLIAVHAGVPRFNTTAGTAGTAVTAAAMHGTGAAQTSGHGKHGLFGSSVTGTEALFALLAADWVLLVAVLMWRYSRRWIRRPQFA